MPWQTVPQPGCRLHPMLLGRRGEPYLDASSKNVLGPVDGNMAYEPTGMAGVDGGLGIGKQWPCQSC